MPYIKIDKFFGKFYTENRALSKGGMPLLKRVGYT